MSYAKLKEETYLVRGINNKVSPYDNAKGELRDLVNMNFAAPGALTKRPGSTLYLGATVQNRITGLYEFERLNGSSYIIATANTNAYTVTSSFNPFKTNILNNAIFDFVTFVDRLFACNGQDFFKYDGNTALAYSLPAGASGWGVTAVVGGGLSGVFVASWGYINERGYVGPSAEGITISLNGATFGTIGYVGLTSLAGFGITALQFYRSSPGNTDTFGTTTAVASATTANDTGWPLTTLVNNSNLYFTLAPRYLEIYNNQLFMAGFSSQLSTVYWSNIGEPEGVDPTFFAEFRTNDGDRVSGMKTYNGSLIVTKEKSFHRVTGDNPDNFALQEISDEYGCISNRAMVVWENVLWFLDSSKGIVQYNGAQIDVVSTKLEDTFRSMNVSAARDNAVAIHNRSANEVWFAIPCNGATVNNCIVVYDYVAQDWTTYEGVNVSSLTTAQGNLSLKAPFVGGYSGSIGYYHASLCSDFGAAITCLIVTPSLAKLGQTAETQYRRFYLNLDPVPGTSQPITINLKTNYGSSIALSRTMYQSPFQSRIDFGLPARSIQAEIIHSSATMPLRVFGYTFVGRFQRDV